MMTIFLIIVIPVTVLCGLFVLLAKSPHRMAKMAVVVAWFSLVFSLFSAFKAEILPFYLKVLAGDVTCTPIFDLPPDKVGIGIILPITFINTSYAEGVIEGIALKITDEHENKRLYKPVLEVDPVALIQGKRKLHSENIVGLFMQFPIYSKQAIRKDLLFFQEVNDKSPLTNWKSGKYNFSLYVQINHWRRPEKVAEFKLDVRPEDLTRFSEGKIFNLCHPRMDI